MNRPKQYRNKTEAQKLCEEQQRKHEAEEFDTMFWGLCWFLAIVTFFAYIG